MGRVCMGRVCHGPSLLSAKLSSYLMRCATNFANKAGAKPEVQIQWVINEKKLGSKIFVIFYYVFHCSICSNDMYNIWYMDTGRALLVHVSWNVNK